MPYPEQQFEDRPNNSMHPAGMHHKAVHRSDLGEGQVGSQYDEGRVVDLSLGNRLVSLFELPVGTLIEGYGSYVVTPSDVATTVALVNFVGAVQATGTVTIAASLAAAESVTIGTITYTFVATPDAAFEVALGADEDAAAANLMAAINNSSPGGTTYGPGTYRHPLVDATIPGAANIVVVTGRINDAPGVDGNAIAMSDVGTHVTVSGTFMAGGTDGTTLAAAGTIAANVDGSIVWHSTTRTNLTTRMDIRARVTNSPEEGQVCFFVPVTVNPSEFRNRGLGKLV